MVYKTLQAKQTHKKLKVYLAQVFISGHPALNFKYSETLDQEWYKFKDPVMLDDWFDLYKNTKWTKSILDKYKSNKRKKRFMIRVAGKAKVRFIKIKQAFIKHYSNPKWTLLIMSSGKIFLRTALYAIFKRWRWSDKWYKKLKDGIKIALSENAWTDNKFF